MTNARQLIEQVLAERDDISKLPMSRDAKRYTRMSGQFGVTLPKFKLYTRMVAGEVNGGVVKGFKNKDATGKVKRTF